MAATVPVVTAGDDVRVQAPEVLTLNGSVYNASTATISAAIVDAKGETTYVPAAAQSSSETGSDWTNGVVVCAFAAANTTGIPYGYCYLEIQATKAGVKTTFPLMRLFGQRGVVP